MLIGKELAHKVFNLKYFRRSIQIFILSLNVDKSRTVKIYKKGVCFLPSHENNGMGIFINLYTYKNSSIEFQMIEILWSFLGQIELSTWYIQAMNKNIHINVIFPELLLKSLFPNFTTTIARNQTRIDVFRLIFSLFFINNSNQSFSKIEKRSIHWCLLILPIVITK